MAQEAPIAGNSPGAKEHWDRRPPTGVHRRRTGELTGRTAGHQPRPILIGILPSGLGVYQCPFVDIWGSSIAVAGPHPSFRAPKTQESGASFVVSRTEKPTRPVKSGYKKQRFRRRPCLYLSPATGGGGNSPHNHGHRQQQQQTTLRLSLGWRS